MRRLALASVVVAAMLGACSPGPDLSTVEWTEHGDAMLADGSEALPGYDKELSLETDPAVGMAAPAFSGPDMLSGEPVSVGGQSDRPVLLTFYAHWCPHCRAEVEELTESLPTGKLAGGAVRWVAVSVFENPGRGNHPPEAWLISQGWPTQAVSDVTQPADSGAASAMSVAQAYGVVSVPFAVMVGTDGRVLMRESGSMGVGRLEAFIAAAVDAGRSS